MMVERNMGNSLAGVRSSRSAPALPTQTKQRNTSQHPGGRLRSDETGAEIRKIDVIRNHGGGIDGKKIYAHDGVGENTERAVDGERLTRPNGDRISAVQQTHPPGDEIVATETESAIEI